MTQRKASPETLARLCEAVDREVQAGRFASPALETPLARYRAETTPPLRSGAEVDAEIAKLTRECVRDEWAGDDVYAKWESVTKLCAEPTAPEPAPSAEVDARPKCIRCGQRWIPTEGLDATRAWCLLCVTGCARPREPEPNPLTDHDQDTREERPCGCEDSDRLNGYLRDIKFLHRQWSDEKGLAGHTLTQIGNVVLRWMSNLP